MPTEQKVLFIDVPTTAKAEEPEMEVSLEHNSGIRVVRFGFPLSGTAVHRDGNDLVLEPEMAVPVRLKEFFDIDDWEDLPQLSFALTFPITVQQLLERLGISPEEAEGAWQGVCSLSSQDAGSGCGQYRDVTSGGDGEYRSSAGELLKGVSALGDLGTDFYGFHHGGRVLLNADEALYNSIWGIPPVFDEDGGDGEENSGGGSGGSGPVVDTRYIFRFSEDELMATTVPKSGSIASSSLPGAVFSLKGGSGAGAYGFLTLNQEGSWSYARTADLNFMANGRQYDEAFTVLVTLADGTVVERQLIVDISGNNDAPVMNDAAALSDDLSLAGGTVLSGTLTGSDGDEGDSARLFSANQNAGTLLFFRNGVLTHTGAAPADYGTLAVNADGTWSFRPVTQQQKDNLSALNEGEEVILSIPISGKDGSGASGTGVLVITITGSDQAPVFNAETMSAATGEDALMASGSLSGDIAARDYEGAALIWTPASIKGVYGTFTVDAAGHWTYTRDMDINFMAGGQTYRESFPVTVSDGTNDATENFTILISGDNDNPFIIGTSYGPTDVFASNGVVLSGSILAGDVDAGDTLGRYSVIGAITATMNSLPVSLSEYGVFAFAADGTWTLTAQTPAQKAKMQSLQSGETLDLIVPVQVLDGFGAAGTGTVAVYVNGSNSIPVFTAGDLSKSIGEDALIVAGGLSGTLTADDTDSDLLSYSLVGSGAGAYGVLSLDASGNWTYTPTRDINVMAAGQDYVDTFTVRVSDGRGGTDEQALTVTVIGDNDAPVVGTISLSAADQTLFEGTVLSGTVPASDPDDGDFARNFTAGTAAAVRGGVGVSISDYGEFSLDAAGNWTFRATTPEQQSKMLGLAKGETLTITVPVTAEDGSGATDGGVVALVVTGTNQAPEFTSASLAATAGEKDVAPGSTPSGVLNALDPDTGDVLTYSVGSGTGLYGNLTVEPDGIWTYTPTGDVSFLPEGQSYTETFTVLVSDGKGGVTEETFTLTVSGSNDAPVLQNASASATDSGLAAGPGLSGRISGADPDAGDTVSGYTVGTVGASRNGTAVNYADYGTLVMGTDGNWTFVAVTPEQQQAVLGLGEGETLIVSVPVWAQDGLGATSNTAVLTITVTGSNQIPVFTAETLIAVTHEDVIVADGSYSGNLVATDPDTGDTLTFSVKPGTGSGIYGDFTLTGDGTWTYTPKTDLNFMAEGQTYTETFTAVVTDEHGVSSEQVFTLTITGDNDAPIVPDVSATVADAYLSSGEALSGNIAGNDPEGDAIAYSMGTVSAFFNGSPVDMAAYGILTLDADGQWSFAPQNQAQADALAALKPGDGLVLIMDVTGTDPHNAEGSGVLTITVSGTNQGPAVQDASFSTTDTVAAQVSGVSGAFSGSDPEGDPISYSLGTASAVRGDTPVNIGDYGELSVEPDTGVWTFRPASQTQTNNLLGLQQGEVLTITVPVIGGDPGNTEGGGILTITVTGTNEAPAFDAGTLSASTHEDTIAAQGYYGGKLSATDADGGAALGYHLKAGTGTGAYGTFILQADGTWRYTPTVDINILAGGQTYTETFTAVVTDEYGAESEQVFTLTIAGDNDAPVLLNAAATDTDQRIDNGTVLAGHIPGSDADMGDSVLYSYGSAIAARNGASVPLSDYGTLVLNNDGTWTFKAETQAQKDKILGLREDETLVITVPVTGTDGGGLTGTSTLTITIDGTNQAPVVDGGSCTMTDEDKLLEIGAGISGQITVRDADEGDGYTYALVGTENGLYGALDLQPDGNWIYTPTAGLDLNFLSADKAYFDIFKIRITDDFGATVEEEICLRISGLNDAVVVTGTSQGVLDLNPFDGTALTGQILGFDPDEDGGIASVTIAGAVTVKLNGVEALLSTFGALQMAVDGTWKLISNPLQLLSLAALGLNDLLTLSVPVEVLDNHGLATIDEIIIRIGGGNLPPTFDPNSLNKVVGEDVLMAAHNISGTLQAYDPDGQALQYALPSGGTGTYGKLSLSADGTWTYTLQQDINFMTAGQTYTESFQVRVSDGHGGQEVKTLSINISGQNDAPVFVASSLASSAAEDAVLAAGTVSGTLSATDPDTGAVLTYSIKSGIGTGQFGNFTMTAGGAWTYTPTGNLNTLDAGQILTEPFTAVVSDGKGGIKEETFTLTITGNNDAPVLHNSSASAITELLAGGLVFSGRIDGFDIDAGDGVAYTAATPVAAINGVPVAASVYGDFVLGTNGQWSFMPATQAQKDALAALGTGQVLTVTVLVTGKDSSGASAQSTLTLTVAGQDTAAPLSSVHYEDQVPGGGASGAFSVSGALAYTLANPATSPYINISMDASGNYAYTFTPAGEAWFAALNVGSAVVHVPYTVDVAMPGGAVIQRVLDVEVRPTNAGSDSLYIAAAADGLVAHNPLDVVQSADTAASTYYLDRSDGLLQGNDTVGIAAGVNNITVYTYGGDDLISAFGTRSGMAVDAGSGSNTVMVGSLLSASSGNTVRSAGGSVTLTSSYSLSGALYGMKASGGYQNLVEGVAAGSLMNGNVSLGTNGGSGTAYGMHAAGGTNEVRATSVSINTLGATAAGMYAGASGGNLVYGNNVTVNTTLQGSGSVYGLYASGGGANNTVRSLSEPLSLTVRDDLSGGTPVGSSWSLYAAASGINTVIGGSTAGTSDTISIDLGVNASGGTNSLTTGSGGDTISIAGGLSASGGGINAVNTGSGNDSLRLTGGMTAATGGKNTIDSGTGLDFVGIQGNITAGGAGSANTITGSSTTGSGDTISINGNVSASGGGTNTFTTGAGNDLVNINGIVGGSGSTVATGAGNDTIRLDGSVAVGSLKVQAGTGSDTLVLVAQGVLDFDNNYLSWLKDMLNNTADHSIENIVVEGILDLGLLTGLVLFITTYNLTHADIALGVAPYGAYAPVQPFMLNMAAFSGAETETQVAAVLTEQLAVSGYMPAKSADDVIVPLQDAVSAALMGAEEDDGMGTLLVAASEMDLSACGAGGTCPVDEGTAAEVSAVAASFAFAPAEEGAGTAGRDIDFASLFSLFDDTGNGPAAVSPEPVALVAGEASPLPENWDVQFMPDADAGTVDGVYDAFVDGLYGKTSAEPAPRMGEVEPVSDGGESFAMEYAVADAMVPELSLQKLSLEEEADLLLLQAMANVA